MSRADLEQFLIGHGHRVDARTEIDGNLQVAYSGSSDQDNDYDAYEIVILQAVGHDSQPLARKVWQQLRLSFRWSPQEISVDDDPVVRSRDTKAIPHNRALITVNDTRADYA